MKVQTILSDNGREYSGRPDKHPYEFFLQLGEIEHRTTRCLFRRSRPPIPGQVVRVERGSLKGCWTWMDQVWSVGFEVSLVES